MAAVVHPHPSTPHPSTPRPSTPARPARPALRMLPGGSSHRVASARPTAPAVAVAVAAIVVLLVLAVGGVLALGRGAFAPLASAPPAIPASAPASGYTVVVDPGDTLWSIARRLQPTGDVRPLVDELVATHGSPVVAPGDRISVPR